PAPTHRVSRASSRPRAPSGSWTARTAACSTAVTRLASSSRTDPFPRSPTCCGRASGTRAGGRPVRRPRWRECPRRASCTGRPHRGGAPSGVVDQRNKVGSPEHAEQWINEALDRGERLMGFGHRVYRAYDPRAAALRKVAESMEVKPSWLELAIQVEDVALR